MRTADRSLLLNDVSKARLHRRISREFAAQVRRLAKEREAEFPILSPEENERRRNTYRQRMFQTLSLQMRHLQKALEIERTWYWVAGGTWHRI